MDSQNLDIVAINETRLDSSINNEIIGLKDYYIYRKGRDRNGGGVAVYARSTIPCIARTGLIADKIETISLEIRKPKVFLFFFFHKESYLTVIQVH